MLDEASETWNRRQHCLVLTTGLGLLILHTISESSAEEIRHILLDLDDVLCDFVGGVAEILSCKHLMSNYPPGVWGCHDVFGVTFDEMHRRINELGEEFWYNLQPFSYTTELIESLREYAPVTIATAITFGPAAAMGKIQWMRRHISPLFCSFLIGQEKHLMSAPGQILIDDYQGNIDRFDNSPGGGIGILFPQRCNVRHEIPESEKLSHVISQLERIKAI